MGLVLFGVPSHYATTYKHYEPRPGIHIAEAQGRQEFESGCPGDVQEREAGCQYHWL